MCLARFEFFDNLYRPNTSPLENLYILFKTNYLLYFNYLLVELTLYLSAYYAIQRLLCNAHM